MPCIRKLCRKPQRQQQKSSKYSSKCRSRGTSGGARWAGEPVVIEPDGDENESHDEGAYAAFEDVIDAENHKAYIEAL